MPLQAVPLTTVKEGPAGTARIKGLHRYCLCSGRMGVGYPDHARHRVSDQNAFEIAISRDINTCRAGRSGVGVTVVFALTTTVVSG